MVRADPRWASMHRPDSRFYGGFNFRPAHHPVCDQRARCIHVFASDSDGNNTTLHDIFESKVVRRIEFPIFVLNFKDRVLSIAAEQSNKPKSTPTVIVLIKTSPSVDGPFCNTIMALEAVEVGSLFLLV